LQIFICSAVNDDLNAFAKKTVFSISVALFLLKAEEDIELCEVPRFTFEVH